ncbi:MAG: hypothetical protein WDA22_05030 [Bacteroidota bacterium]
MAQIKIISIEKISISGSEQWMHVQFAPSGKEIYLTNQQYDGIWQYSFSTKLLKEITRDKGSGFNFAVSDDGLTIAYRRTTNEGDHLTRVQEAVEMDIKSLRHSVIERGNSVSTLVFLKENKAKTSEMISRESGIIVDNSTTKILGIENTKIVLFKNGLKTIIDPLPNGQYIWPVLSPDKTRLVAVEMDQGAFISDLDGKNIVRLGKCNSPQWTRDGKWIIGMDDKDDGHSIYASEIIAISTDGLVHIQLTESSTRKEMFPATSPIENVILATTAEGDLYLLKYEEGQ